MAHKHTPGPWSIDKSNPISIIDNSGDKYDTLVAQANGKSYDEANANAKLIAAAPELLQSLIECLEGVKELNGEFQEGWDSVIERAQQAIKKALD